MSPLYAVTLFVIYLFTSCTVSPGHYRKTIFVKYLFTGCTVSPGNYWRYPFWFALIHVDLTGIHADVCRYFTKSF